MAILRDRAKSLLRGGGRHSAGINDTLLQDREKTILRDGRILSLEDEQVLLSIGHNHQGFMGIVPLRCKLGEYGFLSLNDDHVAEHLFWLGCFGYERTSAALFTHLACKAGNVLDLGSYTGYFSVLSAVLAKNPRTFAVEANPLNYHRLCENNRINGARVTACNVAITPVGDSEDTITIFYDANLQVLDTGTYAAHEEADLIPQKQAKHDSFIVPASSFPSLMTRFDIRVPDSGQSYDLIKLDVEGLEAPLLRDIIECYPSSNFLVLVEILTPTTYKAIYSQVVSGNGLALAYINEYDQTITLHSEGKYQRQRGSRNFLVGSKELIAELCKTPLHRLLENYE